MRDGFNSYCINCTKKVTANYIKTDKGKSSLKKAMKKYMKKYSKTDKGKATLKKGMDKAIEAGYFRYGQGAISHIRQGAIKRGISFNLTAETLKEWWHSQPDICAYCNSSMDEYVKIRDFILIYNGNNFEINKFKRFFRSSKHQKIKWMTIDRLQNDIGYELKNIVKACWICNSLKNDFFDESQMKIIAPQIIEKLKSEIKKSVL